MDLFQRIVDVWAPPVKQGNTTESVPTETASRQRIDSGSSLENQILIEVNKYRESRNLNPLTMDARLSEIATNHSRWMDKSSRLTHDGWNEARGPQVMKSFARAGENLAGGECYDFQFSEQRTLIVPGWINSSGHHTVMIQPYFTHTGIGISISRLQGDDGRINYFATQIFGA